MRIKIKEIDGVDITGYNFGIRKEVLIKVAKANELKKFMSLVNQKREIFLEASVNGQRYPTYRDITPIDSELRGYRQYWRTLYTNSFDQGLYRSLKTLRWEVGKCQGQFGVTWKNAHITKGTLFMYVGHDALENVELMNLDSQELIKIKRGSASSDAFIKVEEGEQNAK